MSVKKIISSAPSRLALSAAVTTALLTGYGGRRAYAGSCTSTGVGTYTCSGAAGADSTQTLNPGTPLTVTTNPGFGITTAAGDAFNLAGSSGLTFTDNNNSTIHGANFGIYAKNSSFIVGDMSITTTGTVTGNSRSGIYASNSGTDLTINTAAVTGHQDGINARNTGSGALSITSTGTVTGNSDDGIWARNNFGTDLIINTAAVTGYQNGIFADNSGSGALSITTTGTVTGTGNFSYGIEAVNYSGTDLTINTAAVTGDGSGIYARNGGSGTLSITSTGTVTGNSLGSIVAYNYGSDLTINTAAVTGHLSGIAATNHGSGALSITSTGTVIGNALSSIVARNYGTDLTINTAAVTGGLNAFEAFNFGSGALSITSTGTVTASSTGIRGHNEGTDLTINAATVTSGDFGIYARNAGSGSLSITSTGTVTGVSGAGIFASNDGTGSISINTSGAVTGTTGIRVGARSNNSPATINSSAAITGTGGFAIDLQGDGNDVVNLGPGTVITGAIDFGNGNDGMGGTNPNDIDTLNALPGFNGVVTFADSSGTDSDLQSAPENVSSNIFLINGGLTATTTATAIVVDPSGFAASGLFMGRITNSIFNALDNSTTLSDVSSSNGFLHSSSFDMAPSYGIASFAERQQISLGTQGAFGYSNGVSALGAAGQNGQSSGPQYWVSGFGGRQDVDSNSNHAGMDHDFSGVMLGVDRISGNDKYGLFGGYGRSEVDIDNSAGSTDTESFFAGGYLKRDYGSYSVQLGLVAGSVDQNLKRNVIGVPSGIAKGDTDGWFVSPAITLAAPVDWAPVPLIVSARASYTGMFLEGYTETGSAASLEVSDRDLHLFNTRLQIASPHEFTHKDGSFSRLELRAGLASQYDRDSDDVSAAIAGQQINFSASLDDEVSGFLGASLNHVSADKRFTLSLYGELQATDDGDHQAAGGAKVIMKF